MKPTKDQIEKAARERLEECGVRDIDHALNMAREEGVRLLLESHREDVKAWRNGGGDADLVALFAQRKRHEVNAEHEKLHELGRALCAFLGEKPRA